MLQVNAMHLSGHVLFLNFSKDEKKFVIIIYEKYVYMYILISNSINKNKSTFFLSFTDRDRSESIGKFFSLGLRGETTWQNYFQEIQQQPFRRVTEAVTPSTPQWNANEFNVLFGKDSECEFYRNIHLKKKKKKQHTKKKELRNRKEMK